MATWCRSRREFAGAVAAAALACGVANEANAAFTVCNQMLDIANVAIGETTGSTIETRGWWVVAPNRCADIIPGDLKNRFIYIHAVDVRGRVLIEGTSRFCTAPRQFRVSGGQNCWQRGFTTGDFREIDTGDTQSWTLFLKEAGAGEKAGLP